MRRWGALPFCLFPSLTRRQSSSLFSPLFVLVVFAITEISSGGILLTFDFDFSSFSILVLAGFDLDFDMVRPLLRYTPTLNFISFDRDFDIIRPSTLLNLPLEPLVCLGIVSTQIASFL